MARVSCNSLEAAQVKRALAGGKDLGDIARTLNVDYQWLKRTFVDDPKATGKSPRKSPRKSDDPTE